MKIDPWTEEEANDLSDVLGGYTAPWKPTTSIESLAAWMPPVSSSTRGLVDTAVYKMAVATDNIHPEYKMGYEHLKRMRASTGTLFENNDQKAALETFSGPLRQDLGNDLGYFPKKLGSLTQEEKDAFSKQWIAGQHVKPKAAEVGDALGQVAAYAQRNETYLAEDSRNIVDGLRARIPTSTSKPKPKVEKAVS